MARTVRSPKKILTYLAVAVAFVALAFLLIGDRTLLAVGKTLGSWGRTEASTTTFQTLVNLFPDSEYAAEGLLRMAKSTPPMSPENHHPEWPVAYSGVPSLPEMAYFIKNKSGLLDSLVENRKPQASEKIALLERLLEEYPESKWRIGATAELGFTMIALGDYEKAAELLQQAWDASDYPETDPWVGLYLAQVYLNLGDREKARTTLAEASEKANGSEDVLYSIALAFENLGAYDQAYEIATVHLGKNELWGRLERTYAQLTSKDEPPLLTGKVTMNDQSIAGVRVILLRDGSGSPGSSVAQAVTDATGTFNLYRLPSGTYFVALALPVQMARESTVSFEPTLGEVEAPSVTIKEGETAEITIRFERSPLITHAQVTDQEPFPVLDLEWEEDPRATAYRVMLIQKARPSPLAEVTGHTVLADFTAWTYESTSAQISLEELYIHPTDHPHTPDLPEREIDLTAVLGFRHPNVSAHFYVQPISADGERLGNWQGDWDGLSEARRNLATVELPSRRTAADELLLERDYDAAIAAYKEQLAQEPDEMHSLYVLWALFTFGTDGAGSHKDAELGRHYGERFMELTRNPHVRRWVEYSLE